MATHRRVQSTQAAPDPPSSHNVPPIHQPDTPDHDFNPQQPAPPPSIPRSTQSRFNQDQDSIRKFQENQLSESDEEWHRLVPEEARASLPEREVKRQALIFELIKSQKEYVAELEVLQDVRSILSRVHKPLITLGVIDRFTSLRSSTPVCRLSISEGRPSSAMKSFPISTESWRTNAAFLLRCMGDSGDSTLSSCLLRILPSILCLPSGRTTNHISRWAPFRTIHRRKLKTSMVALPISSSEAQARINTERGIQGLPERSGEKTSREETRSHDLYIATGHAITPLGSPPEASAAIYPRRQVTLFTTQKRDFLTMLTQMTTIMR